MCPLIFARDAILAMALCLCLSVCLSVTSQSCIETDERIEQFLTWELPSTYPILRYKQILVFSKTLSQDVNLQNFATASRSCCQQSSSTIELVDYTNTTVDGS